MLRSIVKTGSKPSAVVSYLQILAIYCIYCIIQTLQIVLICCLCKPCSFLDVAISLNVHQFLPSLQKASGAAMQNLRHPFTLLQSFRGVHVQTDLQQQQQRQTLLLHVPLTDIICSMLPMMEQAMSVKVNPLLHHQQRISGIYMAEFP